MTKGERTKQRMVEAVVESIGRYGFEFTTATTISKMAQVNRGMIVHYFSTIERLIKAGSDEVFDFSFNRTNELMLEYAAIEDPVEKYFKATFAWIKEKPHYGQFLLSLLSRASYDKKSYAPVVAVLKNGRERLKRILDDGVKAGIYRCKNTQEMALMLHAVLVGNFMSFLSDKSMLEPASKNAIRTAHELLYPNK